LAQTLVFKQMKNYKKYSIIILLSVLATSCKNNYIDRTPGVALDEIHVFSDPILAAQFADNAYNYRINDYARFNDHRGSTSQASDEAVSGNSEGTVTTLNTGDYFKHSLAAYENDIGDVYSQCYAGIAITNKMLANIDAVPVNTAAQAAIFPRERIRGEMYFLRAYFYFELIKRFGGVILINKVYTVNDNVNLPRSSYDECVAQILGDLAQAISLLGYESASPGNYVGRASKGAAMALKARTLLFAASPLNNPSNDKTKWASAATAAQDIISSGQYKLSLTYGDILNQASSQEYIQIFIRGPRAIDGIFADYAMSPASGGAQGQMDPTQNHVDMYEMLNGKSIKDGTSGYNPQNPYVNRDPRFYANILYNGQAWQGKTMDTYYNVDATGKPTGTSGKDIATGITYTATGYYCKKYWPEVYNRTGTTGTTFLNYIYFRYGEVLLNYAEAQNEAVGPDATVYDAVNQIRQRMHVNDDVLNPVTMPPLPTGLSQDQMRVAIRHERAIELAFEDHRWYDIMRWRVGPATIAVPMYGMYITKSPSGLFTYTPTILGQQFQKVYADYQHRYPFPRKEIYNSNGVLVQNPGWN